MRKDGAVAQSVEQRTENPCVGGSIPPHTTDKIKEVIKPQNVEAFFIWLVASFSCPFSFSHRFPLRFSPGCFYLVTVLQLFSFYLKLLSI